jgi:tripartite-type tricarboxylate transporter receptor subunit TctC
MIKQTLHIDIVHVPYKGVPEAITDTIAGRVQFVMAPIGSTVRLVQGGQLRGLAVSLAKRVAVHPNLPTVAELGHPGFSWTAWAGVFAPAKTPRPIIDKLNHAFVQALREPETQQRMSGLGMEATPTTPRELEQFLAAQMALVRQLATKAGIKAK